MSSDYIELLNEVCVSFGFCGSVVDGRPLHVDLFLPNSGAVSADAFADALFRAERLDPDGSRLTSIVRASVKRSCGTWAEQRWTLG